MTDDQDKEVRSWPHAPNNRLNSVRASALSLSNTRGINSPPRVLCDSRVSTTKGPTPIAALQSLATMSDPDSPTYQCVPPPPSWPAYCSPACHQLFSVRESFIHNTTSCRFGLSGQLLELGPPKHHGDYSYRVLCEHRIPEWEISPWDSDHPMRRYFATLLLLACDATSGRHPVDT